MAHGFVVSRPRPEATTTTSLQSVIGRSSAMVEVTALIDKLAACDVSVCVWGERGTGKSLVSRVIHDRSARRGGPFVVVDCAAIPDHLLENALFGSTGQAVDETNAECDNVLVRAHSGTLVLDELSALDFGVQARLFEVLRTREIRMRSGIELRVSIRPITTMSRNPVRAVEEGALIENLYYRVAVVLIRLPALRERPEDIPLLVEHFLRSFAATYGKPYLSVAPGVVERMLQLSWPGNVRQLEDLLRQAFLLAEGDLITEQDLSMTDMVRKREAGLTSLREVS